MAANLGHRTIATAEEGEAQIESILKLSLRVRCTLDEAAHAAWPKAGTGGASASAPAGGTAEASIGATRSRSTPSAS